MNWRFFMSMISKNFRIILAFVLLSIVFCMQKVSPLPIASAAGTVTLTADTTARTATISNEYITIRFDSSGKGVSLKKGGTELIGSAAGFYWSTENGGLSPTQLQIVTNTSDMVDIAYVGSAGELHYVVRSGVSGVYSYYVTDSVGTIAELRTVYRVDGQIFRNAYIGERSGSLPTLAQIQGATELQDSTYQLADGTIYTKYDWAGYYKNDFVHGVYGNGYGVWVIPASKEYNDGGPLKQDLMVHLESNTGDAVVLNMLTSSHFGTGSRTLPSGKIFGPWLVYVNNGSSSDAVSRSSTERAAWPYSWLSDSSYPLSRSTVTGNLQVADGRSTSGATVVLAKSGEIYTQGNDYMFWATVDSSGNFSIPKVRPGTYMLYAYATSGDITHQYSKNITVSGITTDLGTLTWAPQNYTNKLWQIGKADRKATEFKFGNISRQYGLPAQVPANFTYTIGTTHSSDWYYAQTKIGSWDINFNLTSTYSKNAYLTVAMASIAKNPITDVFVNGTNIGTLDYSSINDGTTYRSVTESGRYQLQEISFPASLLIVGTNTVSLKMKSVGTDGGILYDTIKLEAN